MTTQGSEGKLARVSYLPGVIPPTEPSVQPPTDTPARTPAHTPALNDTQAAALAKLSEAVRLVETPPHEAVVQVADARKRSDIPGPDRTDDSADAAIEDAETAGERSARAHNVSMRALTRRGMSSREMTELLRGRELDDHDVDFEVDRLEQVGLLNDEELASTLVRTLTERKGLGRSAISAELRRRKIDSTAIEEALAQLEGDDELARATEIALKRAPQLRSLDSETAKRRLSAFLMRKGYSGGVASRATQAALSSHAPTSRGPRFQ